MLEYHFSSKIPGINSITQNLPRFSRMTGGATITVINKKNWAE
jgi:hypothetical protein